MSGIVPIPSTRVSNSLINQLLTNNIQVNQQNMLQIEDEVGTGQAFQLMSQDPTAAMLGLQLKEQIAQKTQVQSNLTNDQSYLSQTDTELTTVANQLTSIQSTVETAIGTTSTPEDQQAAAQQVQNALQQLVAIGNTQYQGRYLFAGSDSTVQPFQLVGNNIQYNGNSGSLNTYVDTNQLLGTNVDGNSAFGAISAPVQGATLSPNVTSSTPLSVLNRGKGVAAGSIEISDGTNTSVVNLSSAKTVGDVVSLIEANPPAGDQVSVSVTPTGLNVQLSSSASSSALSINNVDGGTTASDLGISTATAASSGLVTGTPLNPTLTLDTALNQLGTPATATITSAGANNDIQIQAVQNGSTSNNVAVSFVTNPAIPQGSETVTYDDSNPSAPPWCSTSIRPGPRPTTS